MDYLITGGAGFIGSHLADLLIGRGDSVTIVDNLSTGSIRNVAHLRQQPGFRYYIDDAANRGLMGELVDEADAIFHLAAAVGVELIVKDPVHTIQTNIRCTEVVLELARKKSKKVMIASTSEVYGKSTAIPFREDGDLVMGPTLKGRWAYAASKAVDEFMALSYLKQYGVPTFIVRYFNTVGPRQTGRYGMVIPRFVEQALADRPLTVYGDGTQSRCFGHVADVVEASVKLMDSPNVCGRVFNIGSQEEITILELAERVRSEVGSRSEIVLVPYDEAYEEGFEDMPRRVPDLTAVGQEIGYTPRRTLDDVIRDVVDEKEAALMGPRLDQSLRLVAT